MNLHQAKLHGQQIHLAAARSRGLRFQELNLAKARPGGTDKLLESGPLETLIRALPPGFKASRHTRSISSSLNTAPQREPFRPGHTLHVRVREVLLQPRAETRRIAGP